MRALPLMLLTSAALLGAASCTSRTLPLPPPTIDGVSAPDGNGFVTVTGLALENAYVGVLNERTQEGVIVISPEENCETCAFEATLAGEPGDDIIAWQFFEVGLIDDAQVP